MTDQHIDINRRVAQYVALRDKIKSMDEEHKTSMKPYRDLLEKLNNVLLQHLTSINANNASTEAGTVYRTQKRSASIADGDAFLRYVIENNAWDLLDRKANVTAAFDYAKENKQPPPGVNLSSRWEVGVRRG